MKLVLTGGHLTPAYAFAETALNHSDSLIVIGSLGDTSTEACEFNELNIPYRRIFAVKYDRNHRLCSIIKLPLLIIPFLQSISYLNSFRPDVVMSFGSFNSLPVALAATCLGIPFVIHEQTHSWGLANRLLRPLAKARAVSYASLQTDKKTFVTGNPLRSTIWNPPKNITQFSHISKPILYITGGNQGSRIVINTILPLIPFLQSTYQIILQTGKTDISMINKDVISKPWFSAEETAWILHHSHTVITRGGANTTAELMVAGVPSIIIPLPNTTSDEQTQNALMICNDNAGIVINQSELSQKKLKQAIETIHNQYKAYKKAAEKLKNYQHQNAAIELYSIVANTANHP